MKKWNYYLAGLFFALSFSLSNSNYLCVSLNQKYVRKTIDISNK